MNTRLHPSLVALASSLLATTIACANERTFNCTVNPTTSTVVQTTDLSSPFSGSFIGNYEATTNPTGTKTLPGLFGGSLNTAITYSASFALAGDIASHPTGALTLGVDTKALQVRVASLNLDLLGGVPGVLAATLNINYQTFHTTQPTAIYPGGVTIPVPVGNGSVTTLRATQTGPAVLGALVPQKNGSYTFAVAVPVDLVTVATLLDQPVADGTPTPSVLPLTGTITVSGNTMTAAIAIANQSTTTQPITAAPFVDLPLAIPTVLPAGSTANVLMSGTVTSVTVGSNLTAALAIDGVRAPVLGDLNGDFLVNSLDLAILLDAWGGTGPADFDGNGVVDSRDLSVLLSEWR